MECVGGHPEAVTALLPKGHKLSRYCQNTANWSTNAALPPARSLATCLFPNLKLLKSPHLEMNLMLDPFQKPIWTPQNPLFQRLLLFGDRLSGETTCEVAQSPHPARSGGVGLAPQGAAPASPRLAPGGGRQSPRIEHEDLTSKPAGYSYCGVLLFVLVFGCRVLLHGSGSKSKSRTPSEHANSHYRF